MFVLIHSKIIYYSDTRHWMMGGAYNKGVPQASDGDGVGRFIAKGCHNLLMGIG